MSYKGYYKTTNVIIPKEVKKDHKFYIDYSYKSFIVYKCNKCNIKCIYVLDLKTFIDTVYGGLVNELSRDKWINDSWYYIDGSEYCNYTCVDMMIKDIIE